GNFTPVPRYHYRIGVPGGGFWKEVLNSDAEDYGGSGHGNFGGVEAVPVFDGQQRKQRIKVAQEIDPDEFRDERDRPIHGKGPIVGRKLGGRPPDGIENEKPDEIDHEA
ncbi:MAG: hypothetical protein HGA24_02375, partial [Candidatus Aminicenantes bacterium]|nr:hypothetical protein [Candidatus Aminicenantes bacterium]